MENRLSLLGTQRIGGAIDEAMTSQYCNQFSLKDHAGLASVNIWRRDANCLCYFNLRRRYAAKVQTLCSIM